MKRVVVGLDGSGKSTAVQEAPPAAVFRFSGAHAAVDPHERHAPREAWDPVYGSPGAGELVVAELWATSEIPTASSVDPTTGADDFEVECPPGGTLWRIVIMGPDRVAERHSTDTLDYDIVLAGEIDLLLDDGDVHLNAGDALVLPAARHGWRAGPEGCTMAVCQVGLAASRTPH